MKDFRRGFDLGGRTRAVILGKGPSFEKVGNVEQFEYPGCDWLWVGINQAMIYKRAELGISAHVEPVVEVAEILRDRKQSVVIPAYPLYGWNASHDKKLKEHKELDGLDIYDYVPHWCSNRVAEVHPVQSFGTTAHHIVQMLAEMGVKEFVFFGVDGGKKVYGKKYYAEGFRHDDKRYFESGKIPANFDDFWEFYFQLRRKYGLRYTFA